MKLTDLLVSYKQIESPKQQSIEELPSNKYQRMLSYLDNKNSKSDTEVVEETVEKPTENDFVGFTYTPTSTPTNTSQKIAISTNNNADRNQFDSAYDEVVKRNSEASKYRNFLTQVAERESGFRQKVQNSAGAPAWGYFQFMQSDDGKYNNIKHYANTDTQSFLNNPQLQIESAIKLAKEFESSITKADKIKAKLKGLDLDTEKGKNAAMHAMWLAGAGGFRKWLDGKNLSDKKWSKDNKGTSVDDLIRKYNS